MICDTCEKINRFCLPSTTEEKAIIEFCKKIPKVGGLDSQLLEDQVKHINWFANNFSDKDVKVKDLAGLDEKDLHNALINEMKVLRYLMSQHKNKRAMVFYSDIFAPTYNQLFTKLNDALADKGYSEDEDNAKYDKKEANDEMVRQQKKFLDTIDKGTPTIFTIKKWAANLNKAFTHEGNRRNQFLQDMNNGADLILYAIKNRRHRRCINFTYAYEEIINDTVRNIQRYKNNNSLV